MKKKQLSERLGVPDGIVEAAEELYTTVENTLKGLNRYKNTGDIKGLTIPIPHFTVGTGKTTVEFKNTRVILRQVYESSERTPIKFLGCAIQLGQLRDVSKRGGSYAVRRAGTEPIKIFVDYISPKDGIVGDFLVKFMGESDRLVAGLAHELHHEIVGRNRERLPLGDYIHQVVHTQWANSNPDLSGYGLKLYKGFQTLFGDETISQFFYLIYYTLRIETLVKSSEMYALLRRSGIGKEEFQGWFEEQEMVKNLRKASTLSYDSIRKELLTKASTLKKEAGVGNEVPDELFVLTLMSFLRYFLTNEYSGTLTSFLLNRKMQGRLKPVEIFGAKKAAWWEKHLDQAEETLDESKVRSFYETILKKVRKEADDTLKRLGKLWDLLPEGYGPSNIFYIEYDHPGNSKTLLELMERDESKSTR